MSTAMTSYRRLQSEIHRATAGYGQTGAQLVHHSIEQRQSAKIKRHRTHPRPIAPHSKTATPASTPQQAKTPVNTANINPHKSRQA
jgi:hypothetical protein